MRLCSTRGKRLLVFAGSRPYHLALHTVTWYGSAPCATYRLALQDGTMKHTCYDCGTDFDGPAVWKRVRSGKGVRWEKTCTDCADISEDARPPKPCRMCGEDMLTTVVSYFDSFPTICSYECHRARHNEQRRENRLRSLRELDQVCEHCGEAFEIKRRGMRFCSGRCRVAAHRAKHAPDRP